MTNLRPVERGVQSRPYLALQGDSSTVVRLLLAGRPLCKEACWKRLLDAGDFAQCLDILENSNGEEHGRASERVGGRASVAENRKAWQKMPYLHKLRRLHYILSMKTLAGGKSCTGTWKDDFLESFRHSFAARRNQKEGH